MCSAFIQHYRQYTCWDSNVRCNSKTCRYNSLRRLLSLRPLPPPPPLLIMLVLFSLFIFLLLLLEVIVRKLYACKYKPCSCSHDRDHNWADTATHNPAWPKPSLSSVISAKQSFTVKFDDDNNEDSEVVWVKNSCVAYDADEARCICVVMH